MAKKYLFMATHGIEDPERATLPLAMANAALAGDKEVVLGLQAGGVLLARIGELAGVQAERFPPLQDLFNAFMEAGGTLLVCAPCLMARGVDDMKTQLVAGAQVVGAAAFVSAADDADHVMVY